MRKGVKTRSVVAANKIYFSSIRYPGPYPKVDGCNYDAVPLDTSLRLSVAITSYAELPES